jgi:hypothetical protein
VEGQKVIGESIRGLSGRYPHSSSGMSKVGASVPVRAAGVAHDGGGSASKVAKRLSDADNLWSV